MVNERREIIVTACFAIIGQRDRSRFFVRSIVFPYIES